MRYTFAQLEVPKMVRPHFIRESHKQILNVIAARTHLKRKNPSIENILLTGPQGSGKSQLANAFARAHKRPMATIEVGLISEPTALFGKVDLVDGNTTHTDSLFTKAIQTPGCVVHLQEINRPESDRILNGIFSVLDPTQRSLWVDDSETSIEVAPGVIFFASMNEGYQFVGTMPLDAALRDRFTTKLQLEYLTEENEKTVIMSHTPGITVEAVETLVSIAQELRNNSHERLDISTRSVIAIANLYKDGINLALAFYAVVSPTPEDEELVRSTLHVAGLDDELTDTDRFVFM